MLKLPSRSGSLIRPFQPTVVRGFSKYTRITISRSAARRSFARFSRAAYSIAALHVVDRARADDHQQPVVRAVQDAVDRVARFIDRLRRLCR